VESVLAQHARLMSRAGHRVRVIAGRGEAWALERGVRLVSVPLVDSLHPRVLAAKETLDRGQVPPEFEPLSAEIESAVEEALAGADLVVAHNVCSLHKNLALTAALRRLCAKGAGGRWALWHHDLAWATPRYRAELYEGFPWDLIREDWGVAHVAVSEARRDELTALMGIGKDRAHVIPNGVEPASFLKLGPESLALAHSLGWMQGWPRLLLPVRITPRKNIELALRALDALRHEYPRAMLVVTGPPGPHNPENAAYFDNLRRLRDDLGLGASARFLAEHTSDYIPDEVIADFYRMADALLLTSREEGFGIPLVEAGLSRLPVFCSDIPSLRALGMGEARYFSPDADPGDVARLVADHFRQDRVARFAARAWSEFTWEGIYRERIAPLLES
jgi:glycosyltransferase involved in cell wall biosynthesis